MSANLPANPNLPRPSLHLLLKAIGDPTRWAILGALTSGEPQMVIEIAEKIGASASTVSKNLAIMRKANVVTANRAGLYSIPRAYLPTLGQPIIDFGHCLLRFDAQGDGEG